MTLDVYRGRKTTTQHNKKKKIFKTVLCSSAAVVISALRTNPFIPNVHKMYSFILGVGQVHLLFQENFYEEIAILNDSAASDLGLLCLQKVCYRMMSCKSSKNWDISDNCHDPEL